MQLGCGDQAATFPWADNLLTGKPIGACPLKQLQTAPPELRAEVLRWKNVHYPLYIKGHLLVDGGIAAQPARWIEAMLYLEDLAKQQDHKLAEITRAQEE